VKWMHTIISSVEVSILLARPKTLRATIRVPQ